MDVGDGERPKDPVKWLDKHRVLGNDFLMNEEVGTGHIRGICVVQHESVLYLSTLRDGLYFLNAYFS